MVTLHGGSGQRQRHVSGVPQCGQIRPAAVQLVHGADKLLADELLLNGGQNLTGIPCTVRR